MKRLLALLALLALVAGCTINRAQHVTPEGVVDTSVYRSTLFVNSTCKITWDGEKKAFVFDYGQTSDSTLKTLEALAPLLKSAGGLP